AEDGIRAFHVTGVQTCALPISMTRTVEVALPEAVLQGSESLSPVGIDAPAAPGGEGDSDPDPAAGGESDSDPDPAAPGGESDSRSEERRVGEERGSPVVSSLSQ